ncbi:hypothetical protein BTN49_0418 [Candidatus Enterovibrio escicola]|uniref:Uncharacterized protein n=1 Tax=Candidatus Enterovibrio escicola TaxID=1927127 RepID=A0A2A5T5R7_9GAMM|nr:hypothetical protein BTN49_0418 [Candidatus Enterovibrio escacola]
MTEAIVMEPFKHASNCIFYAKLIFNRRYNLKGMMIRTLSEMLDEHHGVGGWKVVV